MASIERKQLRQGKSEMHSTLRQFASVALLTSALIVSPAVKAITVFDVSGPNTDTGVGFTEFLNQDIAFAVEFTTSVGYSNVNFSTTLTSFLAPGSVTLGSFLTTQVGPGTTAAHQIAAATPTVNVASSGLFAPYTLTQVGILSVPLLAAGHYFLTLDATDGSGTAWMASTNDLEVSVVTDTGVTVDSDLTALGVASYAPASLYVDTPNTNYWFAMTGDPVAVIPEPSTYALMLAGLGFVGFIANRRRKAQQLAT